MYCNNEVELVSDDGQLFHTTVDCLLAGGINIEQIRFPFTVDAQLENDNIVRC